MQEQSDDSCARRRATWCKWISNTNANVPTSIRVELTLQHLGIPIAGCLALALHDCSVPQGFETSNANSVSAVMFLQERHAKLYANPKEDIATLHCAKRSSLRNSYRQTNGPRSQTCSNQPSRASSEIYLVLASRKCFRYCRCEQCAPPSH